MASELVALHDDNFCEFHVPYAPRTHALVTHALYMTEYDRDWYLGTESDHDWQLVIMNEKPFLFSLGRDKGKVGFS